MQQKKSPELPSQPVAPTPTIPTVTAPTQQSPFRRALSLVESPKAAPEEVDTNREAESENRAEQELHLPGPMMMPDTDALAQLMANFAQHHPMPPNCMPMPQLMGQPMGDLPAALLAQCPPPPFGAFPPGAGPFQQGGPALQGPPMPPFPFGALDAATLASFQPFMVPPEQRRKNATREVTAPLKHWLNEHRKNPYPTKAEKTMLAVITRMSMTQVSTWFANARRRLKKENKMTWSPRNRPNDEDDDEDGPGGNSGSGEGPSGSASPATVAPSVPEEKRPEPPVVNCRKRRGIWSIADTLAENGVDNGRGSDGQAQEEREEESAKSPPVPKEQLQQNNCPPPPALSCPPPDGLFPHVPGLPPPQIAALMGLGLPPCLDPHFFLALAAQANGQQHRPLPMNMNPLVLMALAAAAQTPPKTADSMLGATVDSNGPPLNLIGFPQFALPNGTSINNIRQHASPASSGSPPAPSMGHKRTAGPQNSDPDGPTMVKRQCTQR